MKKSLLWYLVLIQLTIIVIIGYKIYTKIQINSSTNISINPIKKDDIVLTPNDGLNYFFEPHASSTIVDKVEWLSFIPEHKINSDSLNEQHDYSILKPKKTVRIITLGDSFTYGLYVNTEDNWTNSLEQKLNNISLCKNVSKFEVINLGVPGYDVEYSVKRFEIRGKKYNPDLILWFLKDDDFNMINEYFIPKQQKLISKFNIDTNSNDFYFKDGKPYPFFSKIADEIKQELGEKTFINYQINALKKINEFYKEKLLIFTFPITNDRYKNIMKEFVKSRKYSYFYNNLTNIYKIGGLSFPDGHPNEKGHQIIAKDLFDYLVKNKVILCK